MELKPLNRPPGANRYCGPAAISFITGLSTDEAAQLFRRISGRHAITGTGSGEISSALRACGFGMRRLHLSETGDHETPPTLARWLSDARPIRTRGRVFLVDAGHHWQLITGRRYACGRIGEIVSVRDKRVARRARVKGIWEITPFRHPSRNPHLCLPEIRRQLASARDYVRRESARNSATRRSALALARKHGFAIEDDGVPGRPALYIDGPGRLFDARSAGEIDFEAFATSWDEALNHLRNMIEALAELDAASI